MAMAHQYGGQPQRGRTTNEGGIPPNRHYNIPLGGHDQRMDETDRPRNYRHDAQQGANQHTTTYYDPGNTTVEQQNLLFSTQVLTPTHVNAPAPYICTDKPLHEPIQTTPTNTH